MLVRRTLFCIVLYICMYSIFIKLNVRTIVSNHITLYINLFLIFSYISDIFVISQYFDKFINFIIMHFSSMW